MRSCMLNILSGAEEPMPPALKGYPGQVNRKQDFLELFRIDEEGVRYD